MFCPATYLWALSMLVCPPGDPGSIVVVDGAPHALEFTAPSGSACRFGYDSTRLGIWLDEGLTQALPPGMTFEAPSSETGGGDVNQDGRTNGEDIAAFLVLISGGLLLPGDIDGNGSVEQSDLGLFVDVLLGVETEPEMENRTDISRDGRADGYDIAPFVSAYLNPASPLDPTAGDMDGSGDIDADDVTLFVAALLAGGAASDVTVSVYVEGRTPSESLCDTALDFFVDAEHDGSFQLAETVGTTVAQITLTPDAGMLGTPIHVAITPAVAPLAFSSTTTATWTGDYAPPGQAATGTFAVHYDAAQYHEETASSAVMVLGGGNIVSGSPEGSGLEGTLSGTLAVQMETITLAAPFAFTVTQGYVFVGGSHGAGDPVVQVPVADPTDPSWGDFMTLETCAGAHVLLVVLMERNAYSLPLAPNAIAIQLISEDQNGVEIDRLPLTCYLESQRQDDFGPDRLVYYSDWEKPVVFVRQPVDDELHPLLGIIEVRPEGRVYPVLVAP